jgi:ATP/ADP translocase
MLARLLPVREGERRPTLLAFGTLLAAMAAHGLLETARDALFLARIPPTRLPFVYLTVAVVAVIATAVGGMRRASGRPSRARGLAYLLVVCAIVTTAFWPLSGWRDEWVLYALYVWSATVATLLTARFWLVVSEHFTISQAKRVYATIGAGSVLGAIVGTAAAGALTVALPARHLLPAAAFAFALAAIGPWLLDRATAPAAARTPLGPIDEDRFGARALANPYVRRVALLVLVSTVALTIVDYALKSAVAAHIAPDDLGSFFARFYLILNFVSLAAQVFVVRHVVRALSTTGSLAVLPVLIAVSGAAIAAGGGLLAAVGAKAIDGGLRHSLNRTAIELLYVPMADRVRSAAKALGDVLAQRGGQALASLAILLAVALDARDAAFGALVTVLAVVWLALAIGLRAPYLELFRTTLREGAHQPRVQYPELDLSSLESVIAALNSRHDAEVRAALSYLASEGRTRLVPALILYHPSPEVVVDALDILVKSGRRDFLPITERLLAIGSPDVRAAALRARTALEPDPELLEAHATSDCAALRATALVGLAALGKADASALERLEAIAREGDGEAKITLANAIRFRPSSHFEDILLALARDARTEVQRAALGAMAAQPSARYLGPLVKMLGQRRLRSDARATLVELGETAFSYLCGALADDERPVAIRRHLPRTLMRFDPQRAASALLEQLPVERDGVVRYKILRGLGFLRAHHPEIVLDRGTLAELVRLTVGKTYQLLEWRSVLERGTASDPARATPTQELLIRLLRDKEDNAIERLFRMLGLTHATEDVATIYRGLYSHRADVRASSRELVEHLLDQPLRDAVLGLIDDGPADERLALAGPLHEPVRPSYEGVLAELLDVAGESLRSIAVYHIGELGLTDLRPRVEALESSRDSVFQRVRQRALELLELPPARRLAAGFNPM